MKRVQASVAVLLLACVAAGADLPSSTWYDLVLEKALPDGGSTPDDFRGAKKSCATTYIDGGHVVQAYPRAQATLEVIAGRQRRLHPQPAGAIRDAPRERPRSPRRIHEPACFLTSPVHLSHYTRP